MINRIWSYCAWVMLASAILLLSAGSRAADLYDAAVQHPGRSAADLKRDAADHPAELLRLAGIKPGMQVADTGSADAGTLHRIDEAYTVHDFEKRGFKVIARSDLLRRPDDKRELVSYTPPGLGKTDRFVLVFRKQ